MYSILCRLLSFRYGLLLIMFINIVIATKGFMILTLNTHFVLLNFIFVFLFFQRFIQGLSQAEVNFTIWYMLPCIVLKLIAFKIYRNAIRFIVVRRWESKKRKYENYGIFLYAPDVQQIPFFIFYLCKQTLLCHNSYETPKEPSQWFIF